MVYMELFSRDRVNERVNLGEPLLLTVSFL